MNKLKELSSKINQLQQIIDSETESAEMGDNRARSIIIQAEEKKDSLQSQLDAFALWFAFLV